MSIRLPVTFGALALTALCLFSCNVFSPFDSPSGDAQLLSAARACFDRGDFDCAREYYEKLSSAYADTVTSEKGFLTLDQQGASMAAYMQFVGDMSDSQKGTGVALTNFANRLLVGSGVDRRVAIWNVYNDSKSGIQGSDLKNFIQFVSATALVAEMLAEASTGSQLLADNLTAAPASCLAATCTGNASCNQPSGATLVTASGAPSIATASPTNAQPTMTQLYDAIDIALTALNNLSASGKFSNTTNAFKAIQDAVDLGGGSGTLGSSGPADQCFRQQLLSLGVGTT